jgi:DNA-binding response OmpR family regulator
MADQSPTDNPIKLPDTPIEHVSSGMRILCVEDEHFIGELYTRALTKAGYEVKVVYDGEQGLNEAQTDQYDIILLDIMVPSLKGTEILERLRDHSITPNLKAKVIITTNLDQAESNRDQVEKLADGYIIKADVTPKELVEVLNQFQ